jgi:hypothetical protein
MMQIFQLMGFRDVGKLRWMYRFYVDSSIDRIRHSGDISTLTNRQAIIKPNSLGFHLPSRHTRSKHHSRLSISSWCWC